jgi:hypothetical protein
MMHKNGSLVDELPKIFQKKNCSDKINPNSTMIHKIYKLNKQFTK